MLATKQQPPATRKARRIEDRKSIKAESAKLLKAVDRKPAKAITKKVVKTVAVKPTVQKPVKVVASTTRQMKAKEEEYSVRLANVGNPDWGQPVKRPINGSHCYDAQVKGVLDARMAVLAYIKKFGLGGSNWTGGAVYRGKTQIAYISYNGRIWATPQSGEKHVPYPPIIVYKASAGMLTISYSFIYTEIKISKVELVKGDMRFADIIDELKGISMTFQTEPNEAGKINVTLYKTSMEPGDPWAKALKTPIFSIPVLTI